MSRLCQLKQVDDGTLVGVYGALPPSLNSIYKVIHNPRITRGPKTRKIMSTEANNWMKTFLADMAPKAVALNLDPAALYDLELTFQSPQFLRVRPGKKEGYVEHVRKIDSSNLVKLAEDCISALVAVDDSHFWNHELIKQLGDEELLRFKLAKQPDVPWKT
jgi:hypothetical protein